MTPSTPTPKPESPTRDSSKVEALLQGLGFRVATSSMAETSSSRSMFAALGMPQGAESASHESGVRR